MTVLCCVTLRTVHSGLTVALSRWKPTPAAIQPKVAMKSGSMWSRASTFPSMEGGDCSGQTVSVGRLEEDEEEKVFDPQEQTGTTAKI